MTILFLTIFSLFSTAYSLEKMEYNFPDIVGKYICHGYDPYAKEKNYIETYSIQKKGATYFFEWVDKNGYPTSYGVGIVNDALENTIAVAYENVNNEYKGIILYKINNDGTLKGTWAAKKDDLTGSETCKKE